MALDLAERGRQLVRVFYRVVPDPGDTVAADSGIADEVVSARLVDLGVPPSVQIALSLVPLIEVAWADGEIQDEEREALERAAEANGMVTGSPSRTALSAWLAERPDELLDAWVGFVAALLENLSAGERMRLAADVLDRARTIAEAAGGFLGLATVSDSEQAILRKLDHAFKFPEQFATLFER